MVLTTSPVVQGATPARDRRTMAGLRVLCMTVGIRAPLDGWRTAIRWHAVLVPSDHERLIDGLETSAEGWASSALVSCLQRLRDGGPTQFRDVTVLDAWPIADGFCVVYEMYAMRLGVRVTRTTGEGPPFFFSRGAHGADPDPRVFGVEIADYAIAEPLGESRR